MTHCKEQNRPTPLTSLFPLKIHGFISAAEVIHHLTKYYLDRLDDKVSSVKSLIQLMNKGM